MDLSKLKTALSDLMDKRAILDDAIANLQKAIHALNGNETQPVTTSFRAAQTPMTAPATTQDPSYSEEAIAIVEQLGRPVHIDRILKAMETTRGRELVRASVESSILRYIKRNGDKARIKKFGKGTYGPAFFIAAPDVQYVGPPINLNRVS